MKEPNRTAMLHAAEETRKNLYKDYIRDEILIRKTNKFIEAASNQLDVVAGLEEQVKQYKKNQSDLVLNISYCDEIIEEINVSMVS